MTAYTGIIIDQEPLVGVNERPAYANRDTVSVDASEVLLVGTWTKTPYTLSYTPKAYSGVVIDRDQVVDWPDLYAQTISWTRYRNTTQDAYRLKDRFYGQQGQPRFVCSGLVPGLEYILTINLEEGAIGGPYTTYTPVEYIYTATAATMTIDLYLPIATVDREIRMTTYTNVRHYT